MSSRVPHPAARRLTDGGLISIVSVLMVSAFAALAGSSCSSHAPAMPDGPNPNQPGLAFVQVPGVAILNGAFDLQIRLNDMKGVVESGDSQTPVTVKANGAGTLGGTLTRTATAGVVDFSDLRYDHWELVTLTISAPGFTDVVSPPFVVHPILRFGASPPARAPVDQPVGPFVVDLVDATGALVPSSVAVTLGSTDPYAIVDGGPTRTFDTGTVKFDAVTLETEGAQTVAFTTMGLGPLAQGLMIYADTKTESLWLRGGRVGSPYVMKLPAGHHGFQLSAGTLPTGLTLDPAGEIAGTPLAPGYNRFQITSLDDQGVKTTWLTTLVVASLDPPDGPALDDLDRDGPYQVAHFDETISVASMASQVTMRIYHPVQSAPPSSGGFPLVVFHHGAARLENGVTTLFDHYDPLLTRWASYGFVVTSVDGMAEVYDSSGYLPLTIGNLSQMAENIRASLVHMRGRALDPTFPLYGQVDLDRVILAGHSRGAGAAIIAAHSTPSIVGMLLVKPVDPMIAYGADMSWDQPLPPRPALITIAGNDNDVVYPVADFLYERRSAPATAATVLGTIHAYSCDVCPPEPGATPAISREQDWAITNAYAVAFLKYVTGEDPSMASVLFQGGGLSTALSPLGVLRRSDDMSTGLLVDDFQGEQPSNSLGQTYYVEGSLTTKDVTWVNSDAEPVASLGGLLATYERPDIANLSHARELDWTADGAVYGNTLGTVDLHAHAWFSFRARSLGMLPINASQIRVRMFAGESGANGAAEVMPIVGAAGVGARFGDVLVPLQQFIAQGVNLADVTRIEIVLGGSGSMLIDDLRFD